jgi:hypothetical protein
MKILGQIFWVIIALGFIGYFFGGGLGISSQAGHAENKQSSRRRRDTAIRNRQAQR